MSATITDKFKRNLLDFLWNSYNDSSDHYYVGISRAEAWNEVDDLPPVPYPDRETVRTFQSSLQAVKQVTDLSYVVPRQNWSAGSIYTAWSDKNHSDTTVGGLRDIDGPYYVITDDHNVYVCLQQGATDEGTVRNSIYKPTDISTEPFAAGPDGYIWKFLYNVGTYNSRRYLTSQWMPVEHIYDSSQGGPSPDALSASRLAQYLAQTDAVPGQVLGIEVINGGNGYTSAPSIYINGECVDSAFAYARVNDNNEVFQVVMKDSEDGEFKMGSGYGEKTWITVNGGGGQGAELRPIVHRDSGGLGFDPRNDLNSSSLMYSVRLIADEYKIFNIKNDFRQVGLIRNPLKDSTNTDAFVGDSHFTGVRGTALKKIFVGTGIYEDKTDMDNLVTGLSSGATAYLDYYDIRVDSDCCDSTQNATQNILYVHQTPETGFKPFDHGEVVELSDGGGLATIISHDDSDVPAMRFAHVDNFSGEVLFIDNRIQIDRDEDQTEDVKLIIDL